MSFMVDPAVGQGAEHGLRGQVDHVLVGVLAELGHVDPEDPDVIGVPCLLTPPTGSKPKPMASVPLVVGADRLGGQADLHARASRARGRARR